MTNFSDFDNTTFWQEPDFILSDLVSFMANKMDAELGITLMVGGAVLTGTLVGEREYLTTVNDLFKKLTRDLLHKPTAEDLDAIDETFTFDTLTEDVYPPDLDEDDEAEKSAEGDEDFDPPPIRYLHLKDPVIIQPGASMSFRDSILPIMRIRLSTIQGWMLGRVTMMSPEDYEDMDDDDDSPTHFPRNGFIQ
jgi:hypothetical protein